MQTVEVNCCLYLYSNSRIALLEKVISFKVLPRLHVEVDDSPHQTGEGKQKDAARDAWMRSQGIEVLRFGGWQVEFEARQVIESIDRTLRQRCAQ